MSLLAILLFTGTMALSLWATIRVRQVYNRFSLLPASSGSTGADTAATILRQARSCHPTRASLRASAMADGLGGSDNVCQPDRALAAFAGDVHRFPEHGYGIGSNGERLGDFDAV